jgi:parallel beta-helix repeat protein
MLGFPFSKHRPAAVQPARRMAGNGLLRSLFTFAALASLATTVWATTYYVAPNGSDASTDASNITTPYYTLNKAAAKAKAGDVIKLRGGTYYYTTRQWVGCSGNSSAGQRITIQSYNNEYAVLDFRNMPQNLEGVTVVGSYIDLKWIGIRNNPLGAGLSIWKTNNVTVYGVNIDSNLKQGLFIGGDSIASCYNITVQNSSFWNNCLSNSGGTASNWPVALCTLKAHSCTFLNNDVYANWGEGLAFILSDSCHAGNNTVHDNFSVNMYLDNATYCTLENNICNNEGLTAYYRFGRPASGLQCANEVHDISNFLNHNTFTGNQTTNCSYGFRFGNYGGAQSGGTNPNYNEGMKNTSVTGNTFTASTVAGLVVDYSPGNTGNTLSPNTIT